MIKFISLKSDNHKFKPINFNSGLNIVAGLQRTKDNQETINGIGKSSSLTLIHLMTGASSSNDKKFKEFLEGYGRFFLEFEVNGKKHILTKNFAEKTYCIDDQEIASEKKLKEYLDNLVLGDNSRLKGISFRQLLNAFARRYSPKTSYYSDILTQQGTPLYDYKQRVVNLSLLGIDIDLVAQRKIVGDKIDACTKIRKVLKDQSKTFENKGNILDLQDKLNRLIKDKNDFVIAPTYDLFKVNADALTEQINKIRSELYSLRKARYRKDKAIKESESSNVNINAEKIALIYDQANLCFSERVTKTLSEAQEFHSKLVSNRISRINKEINQINMEIFQNEKDLNFFEVQRDSILKNLDSNGALEEYNSIVNEIRCLEKEIAELSKYDDMSNSLAREKAANELKKREIISRAQNYLNDNKEKLEYLERAFREIVKNFYSEHGGSLKISISEGTKCLFNIEAYIPRDSSQGINEVKIFCYDLFLYLLNKDMVGFVAHDGCLFSEIDTRQKAMMFKTILNFVKKHNLQYFVNISRESLEQVCGEGSHGILNESDIAKIKESVILKLYDHNPNSWLFGEKFG